MSANIDPTARVADGARLGKDVEIGPYCIVGADAVIGDGCRLVAHVHVTGLTTIGAGTVIYPFSSLGTPPQSVHYKGEPSRLVIGEQCDIRESVTMNTGTAGGHMETRIGDRCLFMVGSHVGHDCIVGNDVIFANNATLGGHCSVGDFVFFGGLSAAHQFVRIGKHAMVGGMSGVEHDVIPYGTVMGNRARLSGLNIIGLKRRGFSRDVIHALRNAYRLLFAQEGTMAERLNDVAELVSDNEPVMEIVDFIRADSTRSICQPLLEDAA